MTDTLSEGGGAGHEPKEEAANGVGQAGATAVTEPAEVEPAVVAPAPPQPVYRVMDLESVVIDLPAQFPAVTLVEAEPPMRTLVFPVGLPEGTALALAQRHMASPRPLTHELFVDVLRRARIDVIAVRLVGRQNGNYVAELDLMAPHGRERVPCRASDGLVMALRMPVAAPILVDERLLADGGDVVPHVEED
jgi:hypothetical protein